MFTAAARNCLSRGSLFTSSSSITSTLARSFGKSAFCKQLAKPVFKSKSKSQEIGLFGYSLLIIPAATFGLGTWQVQRKKWKEGLLAELKQRSEATPVPLPESLEEIEKLEYYPVYAKGEFLHDKEIYMGPRSRLTRGDAASDSALISKGQTSTQGYLVITPFKLSDRDQTILVNRGWVPTKQKDPRTRPKGQVKGEVNLVGIIRLHENRPPFMPANKDNAFFFRDLNHMSELTGTSPIYLDATVDFNPEGGPIGGQTRISLRNEHLSYILTWYSLSALTSFAWFNHFLRKR